MKAIIVVFFVLCFSKVNSQIETYSVHSLDSLLNMKDREVVLLITAEWCKICDLMKQSTFLDEKITENLHSSYYFIELDAELKEDVWVNGRNFKYISNGSGGKHELAIALGSINDKLVLPSVVILNQTKEITFQNAGYLSSADINNLLFQ